MQSARANRGDAPSGSRQRGLRSSRPKVGGRHSDLQSTKRRKVADDRTGKTIQAN